MKKLLLLFVFAFAGQMGLQANHSASLQLENPPKTVKLKITGMTCAGCSNHISKALQEVEGILEEEVKYPGDIALIKFDPEKTNTKAIIAVIENAGYKALVIEDEKKNEMKTVLSPKIDVEFLTDYLIWGDQKVISLLKKINEEEFNRSFGELVGSIHSKTAHILSIYEFFIKIIEGNPQDKFPDLSHLSRQELIAKWETIVTQWQEIVDQTEKNELYALPPAEGQRVEARHIFLDALLHTVHHRGQILSFIRLLGKTKEEVHPRDANLDYFNYLFAEHKELIHPAVKGDR